MATVIHPRLGACDTRAPGLGLASVWQLLAHWYGERRARRQLMQLSDRMLLDLGLQRSDLDLLQVRPIWRSFDVAALERQRRCNGRTRRSNGWLARH
jgi:uncharacterized protein YjiS (DUF1127 family)